MQGHRLVAVHRTCTRAARKAPAARAEVVARVSTTAQAAATTAPRAPPTTGPCISRSPRCHPRKRHPPPRTTTRADTAPVIIRALPGHPPARRRRSSIICTTRWLGRYSRRPRMLPSDLPISNSLFTHPTLRAAFNPKFRMPRKR